MKRKRLGFMVTDKVDDFEQALGIETGEGLPNGGILRWTGGPRFVFATRTLARAAIKRTKHYFLAFTDTCYPDKQSYVIVPLEAWEEGD